MKTPEDFDRPMYVSIPTVAKYLNISRVHAYNLAEKGEMPAIRLGGALRVPIRWLESLSAEPEPDSVDR